jgi:carbon monoxide dehydrogenase subunit G
LGKVTRSIEIEASPDKAFALLCDIEKMNEINKEVEEAECTSEGPMGVGTTMHVVGKAGRFKAEVYMEITEFEKNKKIIMRTKGASTFKTIVSKFIEPTAKGTKLTFINDYELPYSILGKIVDKLTIHKKLEKNMERYQTNMKKALES